MTESASIAIGLGRACFAVSFKSDKKIDLLSRIVCQLVSTESIGMVNFNALRPVSFSADRIY